MPKETDAVCRLLLRRDGGGRGRGNIGQTERHFQKKLKLNMISGRSLTRSRIPFPSRQPRPPPPGELGESERRGSW